MSSANSRNRPFTKPTSSLSLALRQSIDCIVEQSLFSAREFLVKVFISYASEKKQTAERIAAAVRDHGNTVFFDRSDLPEGGSYHDRIAKAVAEADAMIFLISPEAIQEKRYTLTELLYAERKWPSPNGRVLPVMIEDTSFDDLPLYLKSVSVLETRGDIAAETAYALNRMRRSVSSRLGDLGRALLLPTGFLISLGLGSALGALVIAPKLDGAPSAYDRQAGAAWKMVNTRDIAALRKFIAKWKNASVVGEARTALKRREEDFISGCLGNDFENTSDDNEGGCRRYLQNFNQVDSSHPSHHTLARNALERILQSKSNHAQDLLASIKVLDLLGIETKSAEDQINAKLKAPAGATININSLNDLSLLELESFNRRIYVRAKNAILSSDSSEQLRDIAKKIPSGNLAEAIAIRISHLQPAQ